MNLILIENHGPLIVATNFWDSELSLHGKIYCSVNAGAIRILLPPRQRAAINGMRAAEYVVLSRGPWPAAGIDEAVEMLFEDRTNDPYALHLSGTAFDALPAEPPPGREWIVSVWDKKKGKPHKSLERRCFWRRVPKIPWLKPWKEERW